MALLLLMIMLALVGCKSLDSAVEPLPLVDDRYEFAVDDNNESRLDVIDYDLAQEIRVDKGTLLDIEDFFRQKTSKTLVSNCLDLEITGFFSGAPREIARQIAVAYNLKYGEIGDVIYLVNDEDLDTLNITVSLDCDLSIEQLQDIFSDVVFVRRDDKVIVSADFMTVKRIQDFLAVLNHVIEQNYIITVVEVETSLDFALDLQLEISSKGVDLIQPGLTAYDVFSALARASGQKMTADNYHERQLVVTSGQATNYSRSTEKKVEMRAISDQGTSTVSGYENVSAGVIMDMTVNSVSDDFVELKYSVELSNFVGATLDKTSVKVQSDKVLVSPGKIYYIASSEDRRKEKSLLLAGFSAAQDVVVSSIFVKIDKISK